MKIKECKCGHNMTVFNSQYVGESLGLDYWNCALCNSTVTIETGTIDMREVPISMLSQYVQKLLSQN